MSYCYCPMNSPYISSKIVSFYNETDYPKKIYWASFSCQKEEDGLSNICFANTVQPKDQVSYYYPDEEKGLMLLHLKSRNVACMTLVRPGVYTYEDLSRGYCFDPTSKR